MARTTAPTLFGLLLLAGSPAASAELLPEGIEVARRINARDEGSSSSRRVVMELIDKNGSKRVRETRLFRTKLENERRMVLFFLTPKTVKDTAFLTWDYGELLGRNDDLWLYLPALRKSRRIATRSRGKYFLGTDLSYEDIKNDTHVVVGEYVWKTVGGEVVDERPCIVVEATPIDDQVSRELGYSRVVLSVDRELWIARKVDYWDRSERHLKTSLVREIREVDGIWTPHVFDVRNHRTGHRTVFRIEDVDYGVALAPDLFTERALRRGPPAP